MPSLSLGPVASRTAGPSAQRPDCRGFDLRRPMPDHRAAQRGDLRRAAKGKSPRRAVAEALQRSPAARGSSRARVSCALHVKTTTLSCSSLTYLKLDNCRIASCNFDQEPLLLAQTIIGHARKPWPYRVLSRLETSDDVGKR